jgi:thiamine pyrophosphate-dependent acetolactate synthase large subunit-like protein
MSPGRARVGLVGEGAGAVVDEDPRLEQHADRRVSLAVRPHDVLVAVGVDVDERALVRVLGLHGKARRGLIDELLRMDAGRAAGRGERSKDHDILGQRALSHGGSPSGQSDD